MRISFCDKGGLGLALANALEAAGHEIVDVWDPGGLELDGQVLLIDHDAPLEPYQRICDAHRRVLVYPHGAGVVASGDGQWPVHPHTVARFEHGPGQVEVLRRAGYPRRAEVIGWPLCERRPFEARPLRRVLLAPQHALGNGWYAPELRVQNVNIHDRLAALARRGLIELTVRWVYDWAPLGITRHPGVSYVQGDGSLAGALGGLDGLDCVVGAYGTFPALAVARGVPTVFYGQTPLDDDQGPQDRHPAQHWPLYRDYVRFPLDAELMARSPLDELREEALYALQALLVRACRTDKDIADWRDRFVGPAFDPARFVKLVEEILA